MKSETLATTHVETSLEGLARSVLTSSLMSVRRWLKRAARDRDDDESVHQVRVCGRRALSAIQLFEGLLPAPEVCWFKKRLKGIHRAAGRARDLDVLIGTFSPQCDSALKILTKHWRGKRDAFQKPLIKLRRNLNQNDRFRKHIRSLVGNLNISDSDAEHISQQDCDTRIRAQFADLRRCVVTALGMEANVRSLHELRIAVKQLRYAAIVLLPVLRSAQLNEILISLERLQNQLGIMHDHVVAKQKLERSMTRLKKKSHQAILQELIEIETRSTTASVEAIRAWLNSDACHQLKQCMELFA